MVPILSAAWQQNSGLIFRSTIEMLPLLDNLKVKLLHRAEKIVHVRSVVKLEVLSVCVSCIFKFSERQCSFVLI